MKVSVGDVVAMVDSVGLVVACLQLNDGSLFALVDSLQLAEVGFMVTTTAHRGVDDYDD